MKVTMKQQVSGTRDGVEWPAPGGEVDVPAAEAAALIAAGLAVEPVKVEAAVVEPAETAVQSRPGRRKAAS